MSISNMEELVAKYKFTTKTLTIVLWLLNNRKGLLRIRKSALQMLKTLRTLPPILRLIVPVKLNRKKSGNEENCQVNPYDKNEANKSYKENAIKKLNKPRAIKSKNRKNNRKPHAIKMIYLCLNSKRITKLISTTYQQRHCPILFGNRPLRN